MVRKLGSITALVLAVLLVTPTGALGGATFPSTWGWVTARQPTTSSYTPAARDQGNSSGMSNSVAWLGGGDYNVAFPDLYNGSSDAGIAMLSALSSNPRICSTLDWGYDPNTNDAYASIRCFGFDGEGASSKLSSLYIFGGNGGGLLAYLWANEPTSTDYTPDLDYQFNLGLSTNTIHRSGPGQYAAHLPNMPADEGNIQISSIGDSTCEIADWHAGTGELIVNVHCYLPDGTPADEQFKLLYTDGTGSTGVFRPKAAHLYANKPSTSSYAPALAYRYSSVNMPITVKRGSEGTYTVVLSGMPKGGAALVTAVGPNKARCQLSSISTSTPQKVGVMCFNTQGAPVDSKFMLSYTK